MGARDPQSAPRARPVARHYNWVEVTVLLLTFAACGVLFDSGGLVTWANRLTVGGAQASFLSVLVPLDGKLSRLKLTRPRAALVATSDRWSARWAPSVEDAPALDGRERWPTASPAPLTPFVDGPLGRIAVARGDEGIEVSSEGGPAPVAEKSRDPSEVTILLVGDSMMQVGLAPGIATAFAQDPRARVQRETHVGTGLSRPDVFDWPGALAPVLYRQRPRFVVATFGGNDAQDMRLGGQVIAFGTSRWDEAYRERVRAFLDELTHDGAEVLWLGLPPMRDDGFNERVQKLNDLVVAASREVHHVEFLDTTPLVTGEDRAFATYLPAEGGGLVQVRQEDGIHFSSAGGERVAERAVAWIKARALANASAATR